MSPYPPVTYSISVPSVVELESWCQGEEPNTFIGLIFLLVALAWADPSTQEH